MHRRLKGRDMSHPGKARSSPHTPQAEGVYRLPHKELAPHSLFPTSHESHNTP